MSNGNGEASRVTPLIKKTLIQAQRAHLRLYSKYSRALRELTAKDQMAVRHEYQLKGILAAITLSTKLRAKAKQ